MADGHPPFDRPSPDALNDMYAAGWWAGIIQGAMGMLVFILILYFIFAS